MADSDNDLLDELAAAAAPSQSELGNIARLVALQRTYEGEVDKLDAKLKEAKKKLLKVSDVDLPEAMKAAKTRKFVTDDGKTVELNEELTISVPKKRLTEILEKLREWEYDDLISAMLTCEIEKGKENLAGEIMAKAEEIGLTVVKAEAVNSNSVKSILRQKMKDGEDVDLGFFGAFNVTRAKITE